MRYIVQLFLSAVVILLLSWILSGVQVVSYGVAVLVALVIALLQLVVKPILIILTLPITIITLGIFLLFINAILVLIADALIPGFSVANIWWALLFSILLSIFGSFFFRK